MKIKVNAIRKNYQKKKTRFLRIDALFILNRMIRLYLKKTDYIRMFYTHAYIYKLIQHV